MKTEARFEDLFRERIEDLYDAEKQIVDALPKLIAESSSATLAGALQQHLDETKEQVVRLETIFEGMGEQPGSRRCEGMQGIIGEGEQSIAKLKKSPVLDVAAIAAAQRVEHYEIAGYGIACAMAEMLGQEDTLLLLQETLEEERDADENLSEVAESILSGDDMGGEEEEVELVELDEEDEKTKRKSNPNATRSREKWHGSNDSHAAVRPLRCDDFGSRIWRSPLRGRR
jgi:ferritin-like metal-binding protein YciE